jgi:hypothetical protein
VPGGGHFVALLSGDQEYRAATDKSFVILKGYIDESYTPPHRPDFFTLACTLSDIRSWREIETAWKNCLRAKNRELAKQGRQLLSRYHASDCANLVNEFKGWDVPEQIAFTKKLLGIFNRGKNWVHVIAYTMPMQPFYEEFPEYADDPFPACYSILKFILIEIADFIEWANRELRRREVRVLLFHERCSYDGVLATSFSQAMRDETFRGRERFRTLTSLGWNDCIALQPADLMAYDTLKDARQKFVGKPQRKTLDFLLSTEGFGGRSRTFKPEGYKTLKNLIYEARRKASGHEGR